MNFDSATQAGINTAFRLGPAIVKTVTYYRPASFNPATGHVESAEIAAIVKAIIGPAHFASITFPPAGFTRIFIRATELTAFGKLREGDYLVTAAGDRYDVLLAVVDPTDKLWACDAKQTPSHDYGDLTAHATAEDYGDLTTTTSEEDFGALYAN